jgi:acetyltransferase-like isoleucine patch superfamily enzyme
MIKFLKNIKYKLTLNLFLSALNSLHRNYFQVKRSKFGYINETSRVRFPILIKGIENVYLYENTHILGYSKLITTKAKFIMKKNSGCAEGLTVISGTHPQVVGEWFLEGASMDHQIAKDIIVEEDVWIGANVTLLSGVKIGRGAIVGSGSVCRSFVPPYSVVTGNPAKVVGFKFLPKEIICHEEKLYKENDRLSIDYLERNYNKYFINRIKEIKSYIN